MREVLTLILAGGKGTRLEPLTRDRAKPAVPFGGLYRIIDFTLSNCINSDLRRVLVLTQYKARSLDRATSAPAGASCRARLDEYIEVLPPQQRIDENWYKGTADAIYQNIYTIEKANPRYVVILAGDHIYKMDYGSMIRSHIERGADLTIGCIPVPRKEGVHFGIMDVDEEEHVVGFLEKPREPPEMADMPGQCLASMGIYVFTARTMFELLCQDATRADSEHDFGKNIIPPILGSQRVFAYRFRDQNRKEVPYWRDVGTLDAYYQANMDLIDIDPVLNLYDREWPIRTYQPQLPPPKFVFNDGGRRERPTRRGARQHGLPGLHRQRRPCASQHSVARTCASTASPSSRRRSCSTASTSAGIAAFAGRSSTRTCKSRPTRPSATTWSTTGSAASRSRSKASSSSPSRSCRKPSRRASNIPERIADEPPHDLRRLWPPFAPLDWIFCRARPDVHSRARCAHRL